MVEAIAYRYRTGIPWRDLPREVFGPWQTAWKRHRRYAADGTWDRVLGRLLAEADAAGQTIAALTTSQIVCSRRTVAALERGQWWFWDAATTPLLDPQSRLYGAEVVEGQVSRCVNAATTTRGAGEAVALLLLAANLDKDVTLTVSIDEGPETLCARSAEQWALTPPDPDTVRCVECGRPLTDAESARRGYGPGCWERLGLEDQAELERLVLPLRWRGGAGWAYPLSVSAWGDLVVRA